MSRNVQNSSMSRSGHFTSSDLLLSGICYVGKETKILGDAEDVLEEEDAEISFPGSLVSDCLPVLHEKSQLSLEQKRKYTGCCFLGRLQLMPKSYSTIKLAMINFHLRFRI